MHFQRLDAGFGPVLKIPRGNSAACDLGLHCLPITLLRVSRLKWVKGLDYLVTDNKTLDEL